MLCLNYQSGRFLFYDQESRGRRNNVIISGLPEKAGDEGETMEESKLTLYFIKKDSKAQTL